MRGELDRLYEIREQLDDFEEKFSAIKHRAEMLRSEFGRHVEFEHEQITHQLNLARTEDDLTQAQLELEKLEYDEVRRTLCARMGETTSLKRLV